MDETTELRRFRADAPVPDRARLAPGRRRLLAAAERGSGTRRRRWRSDWRAAVAGAAVAVAAAAFAGSHLTGADGYVAVPPAASQLPAEAVSGDAAALLERAAATVEGMADPRPRDGQWVYLRTVHGSQGGSMDTAPREEWRRYDDPAFEDGRQGDDHSPRELFRFLTRLPPDDPEEVLERMRRFYPSDGGAQREEGFAEPGPGPAESREAHAFRAFRVLAGAYPVAHGGLAELYRAMATVEGVEVADRLVRDAAGRDAVALYLDGGTGGAEDPRREEVLLDPVTFTYLGSRTTVVRDHTEDVPGGGGRELEEGQVLLETAVERRALVDAEGKRP
ncbi:CU044_5270 family protein [Streptomyces desertarenae]|uniref:CU044_5270 family protein n=1 Tax=Streptomyces desertarenae TaxID=2666184 RepID=A0ABW4PUZ7_9ACTN